MNMGEWYKPFYLKTIEDEAKLRAALSHPDDGASNRADVRKRLDELRQIPDDRCHVSRDQRRYLERVLGVE